MVNRGGKGNSGSRRQGIFWILTVPYPNDVCGELRSGRLPALVRWAKGQLERGESTGYEHYQMVVGFSKKMSLSGVVGVFGRGTHAELSRSEAADAYVVKEATRVGESFEFGAKPVRVNSEVDWESVWEAAKLGDLSRIPARIRLVSYRTIRAIGSDYAKPVGMVREVFCYFGPTRTGKSRRAWDEAGVGAYDKCPRSKFWDGYQDEENAVIDEFRGGIDIAHILRWFDRYPVRVEIKGSSRPFNVRRIWITSNVRPQSWYPELDSDTLDALMERMTVVDFNEKQ